ncbi:DUF1330 domain-containing protein [Microvirga yunnanensis]|uniref:DUF1330 domain-containing protein n=1 Tax=Microvirga yunnanensis TaxID=2953740 RepID=UPI0021C62E97|nr:MULTISPECIES: DUF1330 domain-containing protein [unclassified Microvirga]
MSVYVIADIKVTNDQWVPAYGASVHELVHSHGGKYLARSGNVKTLEGKPLDTTFIALLEFPSEDAVKAFATDPRYAPFAVARQQGSESRLQMIDDTDGRNDFIPAQSDMLLMQRMLKKVRCIEKRVGHYRRWGDARSAQSSPLSHPVCWIGPCSIP